MKSTFDSIDQVNNLREIQALRRLGGHPHIVKLNEVLFDEPTGRLALVFELMDMNMYESIRGRRHYLPEGKVQCHVYQLLKALDHMHRHGIFHRDVKPENLLLGADDNIKLADLGSCRGIYSRPPYTEYISTRWYRAPECLLTDGFAVTWQHSKIQRLKLEGASGVRSCVGLFAVSRDLELACAQGRVKTCVLLATCGERLKRTVLSLFLRPKNNVLRPGSSPRGCLWNQSCE